jgi:hypothetical protein
MLGNQGGFVDTGTLFSYPLTNARWVYISAHNHAHGCTLAVVSVPAGFNTYGYAGILCPLPSLGMMPGAPSVLARSKTEQVFCPDSIPTRHAGLGCPPPPPPATGHTAIRPCANALATILHHHGRCLPTAASSPHPAARSTCH